MESCRSTPKKQAAEGYALTPRRENTLTHYRVRRPIGRDEGKWSRRAGLIVRIDPAGGREACVEDSISKGVYYRALNLASQSGERKIKLTHYRALTRERK